ncbi:low molecular weight phosphotyrosine protein phosphatase-like [Xenia sp. Carnegie-2017]|uniref:low molecular weight phosphotyrosine protein phosphatase-like n=1 Tax=Xenia sp. Carnegie-2017 TaxID=2897299 RepID=UPI001F03E260|nr:low molecular weight phosphotyrosine protein phosphatase-like [Xenia sp. Carnegie-2017]
MSIQGKSVLFVCRGNICRSPMAMFLLKHIVKDKEGWVIDSAGYEDWNTGCGPQEHVYNVMSEHSIPSGDHRARKIEKSDFDRFDYVLCLDEYVMRKLKEEYPDPSRCRAKLQLLREYDPKKEVFEDPYRGTKSDYEKVFQQCQVCLKNFFHAVS